MIPPVIAVLDYGVGNLMSITNALGYLGLKSLVTSQKEELERADGLILPGVGAFPDAAEKLRASGLDRVISAQSKPVLGICLGMQLLFETGFEVRQCQGLGLIPGTVEKIQTPFKLPHIGWNSLRFQNGSPLFRGLEEGAYVYFVHSFCVNPRNEAHVTARTDYGVNVVAAVRRGNVYGCQFHPEKSGEAGLHMLKNFGELSR